MLLRDPLQISLLILSEFKRINYSLCQRGGALTDDVLTFRQAHVL